MNIIPSILVSTEKEYKKQIAVRLIVHALMDLKSMDSTRTGNFAVMLNQFVDRYIRNHQKD